MPSPAKVLLMPLCVILSLNSNLLAGCDGMSLVPGDAGHRGVRHGRLHPRFLYGLLEYQGQQPQGSMEGV